MRLRRRGLSRERLATIRAYAMPYHWHEPAQYAGEWGEWVRRRDKYPIPIRA